MPTKDKLTAVQQQVDELRQIMHENIELVIVRGQKIKVLEKKSEVLNLEAKEFSQGAAWLKRTQQWKNWGLTFVMAVGFLAGLYAFYQGYSLFQGLFAIGAASGASYMAYYRGMDLVWEYCIIPFAQKKPEPKRPDTATEAAQRVYRSQKTWLPAAKRMFQKPSHAQGDVIMPRARDDLDADRQAARRCATS